MADVTQRAPDADAVIMMAQSRVVEIYESRWGGLVLDEDERTGLVRMAIPILRE